MDLMKPNLPEKEGHHYTYTAFEPLQDMNIHSNKHSNVHGNHHQCGCQNQNNVMVNDNEDNDIYLSLSTEQLMELQNDDTFSTTILKK